MDPVFIVMGTFHVRTYGCQMNKDDSERIGALLAGLGYEPASEISPADIVVFNTCCVREHADDRLYGNVAALKPLKATRPMIIAVGGCLAQRDGERLLREQPHVDIVFGTNNIGQFPQLVERVRGGERAICAIEDETHEFASDLPALRREAHHAWLPVTVGCDNFCTYCIVPYVRGRERSRPLERIIDDAARLASDGVVEITLLGQNVNSYGRDLYGEPRFAELLTHIQATPELKRLRFTTSHPKDLTDDVIDAVASSNVVCNHFHLPLQAGSNKVLASMRRRYTREHYLALAEKIRGRVPGVAITTDLMVGFPGETEADFADTLSAVRTARFDQAFTFIYSEREGTKAATMSDQVTPEVKAERFQRLVAAQNAVSLASNRAMVGHTVEVFVEALSKKGGHNLAGHTRNNKLVHFKGDTRLLNTFATVHIVEPFSWFMIARLARRDDGASRGRSDQPAPTGTHT